MAQNSHCGESRAWTGELSNCGTGLCYSWRDSSGSGRRSGGHQSPGTWQVHLRPHFSVDVLNKASQLCIWCSGLSFVTVSWLCLCGLHVLVRQEGSVATEGHQLRGGSSFGQSHSLGLQFSSTDWRAGEAGDLQCSQWRGQGPLVSMVTLGENTGS